MKWKFEGDDFHMYFEKKTKGHLWIGFGKVMADADIFRIEKTSGGTDIDVKDCYVDSYTTPDCSGETEDLTVVHKEITADSIKVELKRKIKTGDTGKDFDINDTVNNIIYSYTDSDAPEKHTSSYGFVPVDFSKVDGGSIERSKWGDGTFMVHQHGMTIIWTIVCDVLIFIGKFLKKYKRWFDVHAWCFLILVVTSAILALNAPHFDEDRRRILMIRDLAEGEINVIESWASSEWHERGALLGHFCAYILII
jgi:hypothetical protein